MFILKPIVAGLCVVVSTGCTSFDEPPARCVEMAAVSPPATPTTQIKRESDIIQTVHGELRLTPLHHASLMLEINQSVLYIDPVRDAKLDGLPKADAIFITHDHPDHLDVAAIEKVLDPDKTVVIIPPAVAEKLPKSIHRVTVMKPSEVTSTKSAIVPQLGIWFGVDTVQAYNLKRGPAPGKLFHEKGRGVGYVLWFGSDTKIYISGDTECTDEMRALKEINIALVCMNLPYTMPPNEAAECIKAFRPKIVYPYHFRDSNLNDLNTALAGQSGIEVRKRTLISG